MSALKTGAILSIIGFIMLIALQFLSPIAAQQVCKIQLESPIPDIDPQECVRGYTLGLRNTFATPGILLILVGIFIVIMAGTNRTDNKVSGRIIGSDW